MSRLAELMGASTTLFEGAMGTELMALGLPVGAPAEVMTLQHPERVRSVHALYSAAGARVLKTNTFNANSLRLAQCGLSEHFEALNRQAVQFAQSAAPAACVVAGVLGPTGVLLPPAGQGDTAALSAAYGTQAQLLADCGVDLLLIETMFDLREALAALTACRARTTLPIVVTLTLTRTPQGFLTHAGDAAGDALQALVEAGADGVGSNCSLDSATMAALAGRMRTFLPDTPLLVQPCAGQPRVGLDRVEYPDTPADFARHVAPLAQVGIEMLGGCCGTTPAHIAALRAALPPG